MATPQTIEREVRKILDVALIKGMHAFVWHALETELARATIPHEVGLKINMCHAVSCAFTENLLEAVEKENQEE